MNLMAEESFLHDCAPKVSEQLLDHLGAWNIRFSLVTSKHLISSHHGTFSVVISAWLCNIGECSASTMSSLYRLSEESCRVPEISVKCQTLPTTSCFVRFYKKLYSQGVLLVPDVNSGHWAMHKDQRVGWATCRALSLPKAHGQHPSAAWHGAGESTHWRSSSPSSALPHIKSLTGGQPLLNKEVTAQALTGKNWV